MNRIRRLRNVVREYAWGSHTILARLTGRPAPTATPEAELWMGAHPAAPSQVETEAGPVSLVEWIAREPEAVLGVDVARGFQGELPFLFKVLAVEAPLSLQTHPSTERARAGFARENEAGLALDDPKRNYRDAHAKPELVCALEPFDALCGFRPAEEIDAGLARLGEPAAEARSALAQGVGDCFEALWRDVEGRGELARAAAAAAETERGEDWVWVRRLAEAYPGDAGALAPLLLRLHRLAPGEALFLPAGQLHAYLRGAAVELMGNSDNVLRGGLTPKHVDVPELLANLDATTEAPPLRTPHAAPDGAHRYDAPTQVFELAQLRVEPGRPFEAAQEHGVEILLCVEGEARVAGAVGPDAELLRPGVALLVPAAARAYALEGDATIYRARVPASGG